MNFSVLLKNSSNPRRGQLEEYNDLLEQNVATLEKALKEKEDETVILWWWF